MPVDSCVPDGRSPKQLEAHLTDLWRYLWTTAHHAMCTLPSPKASQAFLQREKASRDVSFARSSPQTGSGSLKIQTYCDTSFAPSGGRSRSGILVMMVDETVNRVSLMSLGGNP